MRISMGVLARSYRRKRIVAVRVIASEPGAELGSATAI
jgi:hypothetical protein